MRSQSSIEDDFREVLPWDLFDANVRIGKSGVHGHLALETPGVLSEMDRFGIRSALVSHFTAEEYDAEEGNHALARDLDVRFVPVWAALPDGSAVERLASRRPQAVRLFPSPHKHNFTTASWCAGELIDFLQQKSVLAVISRDDVDWNSLAGMLQDFPKLRVLLLETGYRADRFLFPLLRKHANLFFDTSTYLAHRQLESFVDQFGPHRAVFGSRMPFYTPAAALGVLATARISDEAKAAIAGGTLRFLLQKGEA